MGTNQSTKQKNRVSQAKQKSPRETKASAERKCIASGEIKPRGELVRFVVGPDDSLVPDIEGKLPGRGLWLTSSRAALEKAIEKKLFARVANKSAKGTVEIPTGLVELVERLLVERAIQALALSRRSGAIVSGFGKVEAMLRAKAPIALFEAQDGAADGRRKLLGLAKAWQNDKKRPISVIGSLKSDELGLAFGRGSVIHAALENSGVADRVLTDFRRLDGFRSWTPKSWDQSQ
jgi:predicted RNA-binding protein YlxR (DUF448 family)